MAGTLELSKAMIDKGHAVNRSEELIGEFRRRFALFDGVIGRFGKDERSERIPWFFGFILAAASKPGAVEEPHGLETALLQRLKVPLHTFRVSHTY